MNDPRRSGRGPVGPVSDPTLAGSRGDNDDTVVELPVEPPVRPYPRSVDPLSPVSSSAGYLPDPAGCLFGWLKRIGGLRRKLVPYPSEVVDAYLGHQEKVLHSDRISFRAFVLHNPLLFGALVVDTGLFVYFLIRGPKSSTTFTFFVGLGLLGLMVVMWVSERYTSYVITTRRIMRVSGIVHRNVSSVPWSRVFGIGFNQGAIDRALNVATHVIESAAVETGLNEFSGLQEPHCFNYCLVTMVTDPRAAMIIELPCEDEGPPQYQGGGPGTGGEDPGKGTPGPDTDLPDDGGDEE